MRVIVVTLTIVLQPLNITIIIRPLNDQPILRMSSKENSVECQFEITEVEPTPFTEDIRDQDLEFILI